MRSPVAGPGGLRLGARHNRLRTRGLDEHVLSPPGGPDLGRYLAARMDADV